MGRMIDADALIRKFKTASPMAIDGRARQIVDDMPTIDAVPVIRCRDCKFFISDMEWCEADDEHPARPDSFCSWAERRDG